MLRSYWRVIALIAIVACLSMTAQAAETTLTLACQGTKTSRVGAATSSEVINIGIIVDFQKKTVVGLSDNALTIVGSTETTISFVGGTMKGTLDRVTGTLDATLIRSDLRSWNLKCRPAQRMF
jgi:hypothetical protein